MGAQRTESSQRAAIRCGTTLSVGWINSDTNWRDTGQINLNNQPMARQERSEIMRLLRRDGGVKQRGRFKTTFQPNSKIKIKSKQNNNNKKNDKKKSYRKTFFKVFLFFFQVVMFRIFLVFLFSLPWGWKVEGGRWEVEVSVHRLVHLVAASSLSWGLPQVEPGHKNLHLLLFGCFSDDNGVEDSCGMIVGCLWDDCGMIVGWLWDACGMLQRFLRLNIKWNKRVVTFLLPWGLAIVWATPPGPAAGSRSFQRVFRPSSTGYRRFPPVPAAFHHPLPPLLLLTHFCNNQSHISTIYRLNNQQILWWLFNKVPIKKSAKINNQRGAINKKKCFLKKAANLTPSVVRAIWDHR